MQYSSSTMAQDSAIVTTLDDIVTHMPHQVVLPVNSTVLIEHITSQ